MLDEVHVTQLYEVSNSIEALLEQIRYELNLHDIIYRGDMALAGYTKSDITEKIKGKIKVFDSTLDEITNLFRLNETFIKNIVVKAEAAEDEDSPILIDLQASDLMALDSFWEYDVNDKMMDCSSRKTSIDLKVTTAKMYIDYLAMIVRKLILSIFKGNPSPWNPKLELKSLEILVKDIKKKISDILLSIADLYETKVQAEAKADEVIEESIEEEQNVSIEEEQEQESEEQPMSELDDEVIEELAVEDEVIEEQLALPLDEIEESVWDESEDEPEMETLMAAEARSDQEGSQNIILSASSFQVNTDDMSNKSPFKGVLFPVDQVSESAPSMGSDTPLYVPMKVALLAAEAINRSGGLPLDASPDLNHHNDKGVIGVMTKAEVRDGNLLVEGHLFPFNNPELVTKIKSLKASLGMSVNAIAQGVKDFIQGVEVFSIQTLVPLGANILRAERATWKQTSVLQASSDLENRQENLDINDNFDDNILIDNIESLDDDFIQASKFNENLDQSLEQNNNDMDTLQKIEHYLDVFDKKIETFIQASEKDIEKLVGTIDSMSEELYQLKGKVNEAEREKALIQAEKKQQETQTYQEQSRQELVKSVSEAVTQNLMGIINPYGQPPRKSLPLVQASASSNSASQDKPPLSELEARLIAAETRVKTLEEVGETGAHRLEAIEEVAYLKNELGIY